MEDTKIDTQEIVTNLHHTNEEHTKYSTIEDELDAEDNQVWFS